MHSIRTCIGRRALCALRLQRFLAVSAAEGHLAPFRASAPACTNDQQLQAKHHAK
jgi:hypothetical protein